VDRIKFIEKSKKLDLQIESYDQPVFDKSMSAKQKLDLQRMHAMMKLKEQAAELEANSSNTSAQTDYDQLLNDNVVKDLKDELNIFEKDRR